MSIHKSFFAIAVLMLLASACSCKTESGKKPQDSSKHITNKNVKGDKKMKTVEMTSDKGDRPAIIDFYATWCGPCKATAPNVEKIAEEYDGKIDVYKVDVDQQQELAAVFGVQSIPTILFIPKTGTPTKNVGAMGYAQLKEAVNEVLLK